MDDHEASTCNDEDRSAVVRSVLDRMGDKWSGIVICRLGAGPWRFNEPRREAGGITQRMFSSTLRGLERDSVVSPAGTSGGASSGRLRAHRDRSRSSQIVHALDRWTGGHVDVIRAARADYDDRMQTYAS